MTVRVQMRFRFLILLMLVLVGCASCSYEAKRKTESAVERSIEKFHDQVNRQQYHEIYAESDPELQNRITEADFTAQLQDVHEQMGSISGKAYVLINDGVRRALKRAFSGGRERFSHGNLASSDTVFANERFAWLIENDSPRLVSYEWAKICVKPCQIGFAIP